jgi:hypothetical protein
MLLDNADVSQGRLSRDVQQVTQLGTGIGSYSSPIKLPDGRKG